MPDHQTQIRSSTTVHSTEVWVGELRMRTRVRVFVLCRRTSYYVGVRGATRQNFFAATSYNKIVARQRGAAREAVLLNARLNYLPRR